MSDEQLSEIKGEIAALRKVVENLVVIIGGEQLTGKPGVIQNQVRIIEDIHGRPDDPEKRNAIVTRLSNIDHSAMEDRKRIKALEDNSNKVVWMCIGGAGGCSVGFEGG